VPRNRVFDTFAMETVAQSIQRHARRPCCLRDVVVKLEEDHLWNIQTHIQGFLKV